MLSALIIQLTNIMLTEIHFRRICWILIYVPEETSQGDLLGICIENNILARARLFFLLLARLGKSTKKTSWQHLFSSVLRRSSETSHSEFEDKERNSFHLDWHNPSLIPRARWVMIVLSRFIPERTRHKQRLVWHERQSTSRVDARARESEREK